MSRFLETLKEVSRSQVVPAALPENGSAERRNTGGLDSFPLVDLPGLPDLTGLPDPTEPAMPSATPRVELRREEFLAPPEKPQQDGVAVTDVQLNVDRRTPLIPHTLDSSIVEQYRKLRTKIQQQHAVQPIRSLLVASPGPGEGKTVTVMNLGLSFAMLPDFKVLVIDGDLRKGTVAKWLGTEKLPGLSNLIDGSAEPENVILKSQDFPLYVMESGTSARPAAELLTSPRLQETIRRMSQHFDLVLVDSPPVNLITDAQMLASSCDAVLLVARAFSTTSKAFQKTLHELQHCRLVGTILNGGMRAQGYKRYYGY
jgi:capsular exopolysaccharide synthesis family protein